MRAGRRSKKVTIQRSTPSRGDYGEEVEAWATLSQPFVNIKTISGSETIQGGQLDSKSTHLITLRETDVTPADRILHGSRVFNIVSVMNPEERGYDQVLQVIEDV
jgi:SPP1 family predicted phage head-tail adaptor